MKKSGLKIFVGLLAFVCLSTGCSKVNSETDWVRINSTSVSTCYGSPVSVIDMANSYFEYDDFDGFLSFSIVDKAKRNFNFESDLVVDEGSSWIQVEDEYAGILITLELRFIGNKGTAKVFCEIDGLSVELGEGNFQASSN